MQRKYFIIVFLVLGIVAAAGVFGYFLLMRYAPPPSSKTVSLGEEFTLRKNETAFVNGVDVSLRVTEFVHSPCPADSQCVWGGLAVFYELMVDGKLYSGLFDSPPVGAPYDVIGKQTDYKRYATFVIDKPENRCNALSGESRDQCWDALSKRFTNPKYCEGIESLIGKSECYEYMAEQFKDDAVCQNVTGPKKYCRYVKLLYENALDQCDSILFSEWRNRCFRDIAMKSGQGIDLCYTLEPNKAILCREAFANSD